MYKVVLDENRFYTGNYAQVGDIEGSVPVDKLPPEENSTNYFLNGSGQWEYSERLETENED